MADISVIKVNNADYTIKDTTARTHIANKSNPHEVTKAQVGLGNVENKTPAEIRADLTSSEVTDALGYTPLDSAQKGSASGVAELDSSGKVPASQLPSFVDDVIEGYYYNSKFYKESSHTTEITPETGKIYVDITDGKNVTYRWGGTAYAEVGSSLALGETSTTAYRGDRGKAAYDHATDASKVSTASTAGLYKVGVTAQGHISSVASVQKSDITALGIPAQDTTYSAGTGLSLSGTTINHSNSVTAGSVEVEVDEDYYNEIHTPNTNYDAQGHITGKTDRHLAVGVVSGSTQIEGVRADYQVNVKPTGTVSKPNVTVSPTSASTVTAVATAGTTPTWSASVTNETLSFSFNAGAMPTFSTGNRLTAVSAELASTPTFTGDDKYIAVGFDELVGIGG